MGTKSKIVLISGPTASGKSEFAIKLAKKFNGEIINADSMQVYKQLKFLTARPNKKNQKKIRHHLYGYIDTNKRYSTGRWLKDAIKKIREIKKKDKIPILVGGTGLYFYSLINGLVKIPKIPLKIRNETRFLQKNDGQQKFYKKLIKLDPNVKNRIDSNDIQRSIRAFEIKTYTKVSMYDWINKTKPIFKEEDFIKYYINFERKDLIKRIEKRTSQMIKSGAIKEVRLFKKLKVKNDHSINKVIGLNELKSYLDNKITLQTVKELIIIKTRQYAKRQSTWARGKMSLWIKLNPYNLNLK